MVIIKLYQRFSDRLGVAVWFGLGHGVAKIYLNSAKIGRMYKSYQLPVVWYSTEYNTCMTNEGKCLFKPQ
jgi:hypothetical protein